MDGRTDGRLDMLVSRGASTEDLIKQDEIFKIPTVGLGTLL